MWPFIIMEFQCNRDLEPVDPGSLADQNEAPGPSDILETPLAEPVVPVIDDMIIADKFINMLKNASLDDEAEQLGPEVLHQLHHPIEETLTIDNPDKRLSLDVYLLVTNTSEETYNSIRTGILR